MTQQLNPTVFEFEAIGTHWWCEDLSGKPLPDQLQSAILQYAETFNGLFSRFIESSLISRLNRGERINNPPKELLDMLNFSKDLFFHTDGAFNISVGGFLHSQGYGSRKYGAPIWNNPWEHIQVSAPYVQLPKAMTIDSGGYGKGWMIDHIAKMTITAGVQSFIINGGGDMYVHADSAQEIALEDPRDPSKLYGTVSITRGALAASSNLKRSWFHRGNTLHHIIHPQDPEAALIAGSFVLAKSALIADSLATAVIVKPELAERLAKTFDAHIKLVD